MKRFRPCGFWSSVVVVGKCWQWNVGSADMELDVLATFKRFVLRFIFEKNIPGYNLNPQLATGI